MTTSPDAVESTDPADPTARARRRFSSRDLALVASFAALTAVLGLPGAFTLFGNAVPITLQSMAPMLAGCILGARRGAAAMGVFLALLAAGLPLLAGGRGGLAVFVGASAGYFVIWPVAAYVIGRLSAGPGGFSTPRAVVANVVGGVGLVYAAGVPVQAFVVGTQDVAQTAVLALAFLPGDLTKVAIATVVAAGVARGYPALRRQERVDAHAS